MSWPEKQRRAIFLNVKRALDELGLTVIGQPDWGKWRDSQALGQAVREGQV